eukprot:1903983-Pyramimonas_sp.AAC.1
MACLGGSRPHPFYYEIWSKHPKVWRGLVGGNGEELHRVPLQSECYFEHSCHLYSRGSSARNLQQETQP